jgi:3-deoxy-D-manno-octulosonic acid kinase
LNAETTASAEKAFERGEHAGVREFVRRPFVAFVRAFSAPGEASRFASAVTAGYAEIAHAGKLWDAERVWRDEVALVVDREDRTVVVRREWLDLVAPLLEGTLGGEPVAAGRGAVYRVATARGALVVRPCRRGGGMRWAGDRYFGLRPRPIREFWLLLRARRRGLAVPDPVAAVVERVRPGYRGMLVTVEIPADTLWEALRAGRATELGRPVGMTLRAVHDAGLAHPDLNLTNVLVASDGRIALVDLDRARLLPGPLGPISRRAAIRRVRRSARRLDPAAKYATARFLDAVEAAYAEPPSDETRTAGLRRPKPGAPRSSRKA